MKIPQFTSNGKLMSDWLRIANPEIEMYCAEYPDIVHVKQLTMDDNPVDEIALSWFSDNHRCVFLYRDRKGGCVVNASGLMTGSSEIIGIKHPTMWERYGGKQ